MLVKEYRIPLPLTVEEYRIAQLYMIAKKSRQESKGAGSGVEIIVNEPYTDGPGGNGQFTHKIYHVGSHLPGWFKALLPKSALTVEEEAWNAYPYTKTRYTCPFVEKFMLEIETRYFADAGTQDNVFNLSGSDLRNRQVDLIDVVKDQLFGSDYLPEEDPKLYVSSKTNRGPLHDEWISEHKSKKLPPGKSIMCAYKLCKVEFRYWGMQTKIEKFIHDVALRKTMLRAHRQAWAWQDEWYGLTMEDIRRLERETQEALAKTMKDEESDAEPSMHPSPSALSGQEVDLTAIDKDKDNESFVQLDGSPSPGRRRKTRNLSVADVGVDDGRQKLWSRSGSRTALCSPSGSSNASFDLQLANWRMESIVRDSETSSDDEFFDAEESVLKDYHLVRCSSVDMIPDEEDNEQGTQVTPDFKDDNIFANSFIRKVQSEHAHTRPPNFGSTCARSSLDASLPSTPTASPAHQSSCTTTVLVLVLHSGSILDSGLEPAANKKTDVNTFASSFDIVIRQHYPALLGHVSIRLVQCAAVCAEALAVLSNLSPYSFQSSPSAVEVIYHSYDSIPLGALPLFAVSGPEYQENVTAVITAANEVYKEFLHSEEGSGFNGQIIIVADSVASLMAYDALCRTAKYEGRFGSETSINDPEAGQSQTLNTRSNPLISISDGGSIDDGQEGPPEIRPRSSNHNVRVYRKSHSHPQESEPPHCDNIQVNRLLSAPTTRRHSSSSNDHSSHLRFDFEVSDFFMFGSPLGTVLAFRKMLTFDDKTSPPPRPSCNQVYNLFHPTNPCASRIEPLLSARFAQLSPINIPRYQKYPFGDGQPLHILEYIQSHPHLFSEGQTARRTSEASIVSTMSGMIEIVPIAAVASLTQRWWGLKRLDYALYCPEGLSNFPTNALPHLFHASYWESNDVISFILRQLMRSDSLGLPGDSEKETALFIPTQPREKWLKKRTSVKLKNVTANHRANDVIVKEGAPQTMIARFMYGPLDMVALTGEKVDIHVMKDPREGEWTYLATEVTDKNGRLTYTIPRDRALNYGMYPVKLVVRGDHTSLDFFLTVIPPKTECVVFSIDGSFTASVSVTGRDPKVRAGAVDVVRHWQDLGYLILYITGRPDMQQRRVMSWLSQHNFPLGLVYFADGISTDPLRHKGEYLRRLQTEAEVIIHLGYGSSKDISVYSSVGLRPEQIYVVGKVSKKQHVFAKVLTDGYAAHLADLKAPGLSRPAQGNARMILFRGCFGLPGQSGSTIRQRRSANRTTSFPLSGQSQDLRSAVERANEANRLSEGCRQ